MTSPPPAGAPPAAPPAAGPSREGLLRVVLTVATNATVLTGLLVYFGWKRADVQARLLGLDETLFGFSTRDYLLRSVDALFQPMAAAAVLGLAWLWVDGRLHERLDRPRWRRGVRRAVAVLRWAWLGFPVLGWVAGEVSPVVGLVAFPLSFGLGVLVTLHAMHLRHELEHPGSGTPVERTWRAEISRVLVAVVVLLSVFWTITNVADSRGRTLAAQLEAAVPRRPAVVVHSTVPLGLDAPGVEEEQLDDGAYRYVGLRLLHHHDGTFLLVHDGWTRRSGVTLVLHDDDQLRFEFVTGRTG